MEVTFSHSKTYRYETHNESSASTKVLFVLHGYGQLVKYFIRKFISLPEDLLIVAPEGMHRFYRNGNSGRVGASWMTKEARDQDINDTISYLNAVSHEIDKKYTIKKRYLLGFSQGGAAAARWNELSTITFDALILWACVFPPDLPPSEARTDKNKYFVIGDQDEFYTVEDQQQLTNYYAEKGYQIITYNGTHDIVNETLTEIIRQIERI